MANALYPSARERFLGHATVPFDWIGDTFKVGRVTNAYTFSSAHDKRDDLAGEQNYATTAVTLGSKTATDGVADAADITFTAVNDGETDALIVVRHVDGVAANDWLVAYIDTATNLPVTTNGADLTVTWDAGANKIFKL